MRSAFRRRARKKRDTPAARWSGTFDRARGMFERDPAAAEVWIREALAIAESSFGIGDWRIFESMEWLIAILCLRRDRDESRELCDRLIERMEHYYGEGHEQVAGLLVRLPRLFRNSGDSEKADGLYRKAVPRLLEHQETIDGPLRDLLLDFADFCNSMERYDDEQYALGLIRKRARLRRHEVLRLQARILMAASRLDAGDPEPAGRLAEELDGRLYHMTREDAIAVAPVVPRLASSFVRAGCAGDGEALYALSLDVIDWNRGTGHPASIAALGGLARLRIDSGRDEEAEELLGRIHAIRERAFLDAPLMIEPPTGDELIRFLEQRNRYDESESLLLGLVRKCQQRFKGKSDAKAEVLCGLATFSLRHGRLDRAEAVLREAIGIRRGLYGDGWVENRFALRSLGEILLRTGRNAEAGKHLRRALELHERSGADERSFLADLLGSLAMTARATGENQNAELYLSRQIAILEECLGPEAPALGPPLLDLARTQCALQRFDEMERTCARILESIEKRGEEIPGADLGLAMTLLLLSDVRIDRGMFAEAEQMLHRALHALEKAGDDGILYTGGCLERLSVIRARTGRPSEAEVFLERAIEVVGGAGEQGAIARDHLKKKLAELRTMSKGMRERPGGGTGGDEGGIKH